MRVLLAPLLFLFFMSMVVVAPAQQIRIPLPKKSKYTLVQQLNRDGVTALQKHDIAKAKRLFYKAYLIDPDDPFTLNNLGYISELEGDIDRAQRYYDQAKANTSEAVIDKSTEKQVEGQTVAKVAGDVSGQQMSVNQLNREAVRLLNEDRAPEADLVLQQALKTGPNNPFTLNNMGYAKEKQGELEQAIRYYQRAAATNSKERVVVTVEGDWRGKPISEIAARNAQKAQADLANSGDLRNRVARLNLQGVSAMNRNDRKTAREDFRRAYQLDPNNSFAINNMGYLAELDGDKETAQMYYEKAQSAEHAGENVSVATRSEAEGRELRSVAKQSTTLVDTAIETRAEARRTSGERPTLKTRPRATTQAPAPQTQVPSPQKQATPPQKNYTPPEFRKPTDQQPPPK